jgi:hypothetical protein
MKKTVMALGLVVLVSSPLIAMRGFGMGQGQGMGMMSASSLPYQQLSESEKSSLLKMREEEKLARDVYLTLYDKWNLPVFERIANSEQKHMDAIKTLLDKYNLPDPVAQDGDKRGVFQNKEIQNLYNQLVAQGSKSAIDALKVGATIEDVDIKDLEDGIKESDNEDIKMIYSNLERGSRNHMRAFVTTLRNMGGDYSPQYISQSYFDEIMNSGFERGSKRGQGRRW